MKTLRFHHWGTLACFALFAISRIARLDWAVVLIMVAAMTWVVVAAFWEKRARRGMYD